jgi:hypothetical protein
MADNMSPLMLAKEATRMLNREESYVDGIDQLLKVVRSDDRFNKTYHEQTLEYCRESFHHQETAIVTADLVQKKIRRPPKTVQPQGE